MVERNLAVSMRPSKFNECIGNAAIINQIQTQLASGRVPTAYLFSGPPGIGKTTIARAIANQLNAELHEINAADDTGVDMVRGLGERIQYLPEPGKDMRVVVLDEAHQLTKAAQNALLKLVEDAPASTVWIFCTTEASKIIPTLRGRCISFTLQGLTKDQVSLLVYRGLTHLGKKGIENVEAFIQALVDEGVTAPRAILMATERFIGGMDPLGAIFGTQDAPQAFEIARATFNQEWKKVSTGLAQATNDEAMAIRAVVVNYFKSVLLKGGTSTRQALISKAILELTATIPFDGPLGLAELSARLYNICELYAPMK